MARASIWRMRSRVRPKCRPFLERALAAAVGPKRNVRIVRSRSSRTDQHLRTSFGRRLVAACSNGATAFAVFDEVAAARRRRRRGRVVERRRCRPRSAGPRRPFPTELGLTGQLASVGYDRATLERGAAASARGEHVARVYGRRITRADWRCRADCLANPPRRVRRELESPCASRLVDGVMRRGCPPGRCRAAGEARALVLLAIETTSRRFEFTNWRWASSP